MSDLAAVDCGCVIAGRKYHNGNIELEPNGKVAAVTAIKYGIADSRLSEPVDKGITLCLAKYALARPHALAKTILKTPNTGSHRLAADLRDPKPHRQSIADQVGYFSRLDLRVNDAAASPLADGFVYLVRSRPPGWPSPKISQLRENASRGLNRFSVYPWRTSNIVGICFDGGPIASSMPGEDGAMLNINKTMADSRIKHGVSINAVHP